MVERRETRQPRARIVIQVGAGAFTLLAGVFFMVFMPGPWQTADDSAAMGAGLFCLGICVAMALVHILRPQDAPQRPRRTVVGEQARQHQNRVPVTDRQQVP